MSPRNKTTQRNPEAVDSVLFKQPIVESVSSHPNDALDCFHPVTATWFREVFEAPTAPQRLGWPVIARGESTLILAPTGTGKTLTAFLWCLDRLMLRPHSSARGCRVVYISPLKALAVDVERNLRSPLAGIEMVARRMGVAVQAPEISIRTGDTSQKERARFRRHPAEILITTPESLYLLLTSQSAEALRTVDSVIVDEIHALAPTKRGAHLALSLERLEALTNQPIQRIGLSATQRPLEEIARFLGGVSVSAQTSVTTAVAGSDEDVSSPDGSTSEAAGTVHWRPVTVVNASAPKQLRLRVEVPVEDMARLGEMESVPTGAASQAPKRVSIWNAIHPRLLELIRERTSTILFVNSRQVAERLAAALNELAGEPIVRAHHGSLAAEQRSVIEEELKAGKLRGLCATSTLELGIDMGAVDLVVQIESPPSVASGMQRIGRAGHSVGAVSEGVLFPKFRADLIACAAMTRAMHEGKIEATRYPRNPLDVLAQQIVAMVARPPFHRDTHHRNVVRLDVPEPTDFAQPQMEASDEDGMHFDDLFRLVRGAAPFAELTRTAFEGVLDLLAGRYPSDEFAELRARVTWDRNRNVVMPRQGAARLAILNAGTIPDRGLYGVFLAGAEGKAHRVGELDEEMIFESREGETFLLGASTWRIEEITHDRVMVSPAPGEPGKMPFWKGDGPGRPLEFGQMIGAMVRELQAAPQPAALTRLVTQHDLDPGAAENLLRYLEDQRAATGMVPDDRTIVIERCRDELGDWRVCVLTPFGSRIHIPWAMAAMGKIRAAGGPDVEALWSDDGFVLRFPDSDEPPSEEWLLVESGEVNDLVLRQLGATALFAGRFREASARALLLPRRRADGRTPLWQQRKRAYDLLSVASRYPAFPMLLEAYRECMRDVFDIPALTETLRRVEQRQIRVHVAETRKPSPFASSLLFSYVANFLYDGDAPLAERRAQALTVDQEQLRELMGEGDLRELLDAEAIAEVEAQQQALVAPYRARNLDGIHDLLLRLGDLSREEIALRVEHSAWERDVERLLRTRRALDLRIAGEKRLIAVEDAARYRDGLGIPLPPGIPASLLEPTAQPVLELVRRFARTHGPFEMEAVTRRFALDGASVAAALRQLCAENRILEGGFRPGGVHREWCDAEVLRLIRRKSLARLRKEVEPVEQRTLARFAMHWQGLMTPRRGMDALLDAIEGLQGAPLLASLLETMILPGRVAGYQSGDLDRLIAAGEVTWAGWEPLGERDGRVRLFLADSMAALTALEHDAADLNEREERMLEILSTRGASFFDELHLALGGGYPGETVETLWSLVWRGRVTNDSLHPLRAYVMRQETRRTGLRRAQHAQQGSAGYRSRRTAPATATGRWSLISVTHANERMTTALHATARQLLRRYGVLLRENVAAENVPGGFSALYPVLKAMEESGQVRRGYFVAGLGATQFALPAAVDLLRSLRSSGEVSATDAARPEFVLLSATDPANPYGSAVNWPPMPIEASETEFAPRSLTRAGYAQVVLWQGWLVAWLRRGNPHIVVFLPADEPERSALARGLARFLAESGRERMEHEDGVGRLISTVNGVPVAVHPTVHALAEAGFVVGPLGMHLRRGARGVTKLSPEEAAGNRPALTRPDVPAQGSRRN